MNGVFRTTVMGDTTITAGPSWVQHEKQAPHWPGILQNGPEVKSAPGCLVGAKRQINGFTVLATDPPHSSSTQVHVGDHSLRIGHELGLGSVASEFFLLCPGNEGPLGVALAIR
jgi:hypothetical protein